MHRLYADENFPAQTVSALRRLGYDVLTCVEAGQANQRIVDELVLETATKDGRAVITQNRFDFIRLHHRVSSHAGIIVCTANRNHEEQAQRLHAAISNFATLKGRLIRIYIGP